MNSKFTDIHEWNCLGIFILPQDTFDTYATRAQKLINTPSTNFPGKESCLHQLQELYDISPTWIETIFSKKSLYFWEAGCTWIDIEKDHAWIEINPLLQKQKNLFFIYNKTEIISHEFVHVVRSRLESSKFEEFFAYFVSKQCAGVFFASFRSFFGPLFQSPQESKLFCISFALPIALIFSSLIIPDSFFSFALLMAIPFGVLGFFIVRLFSRWDTWKKCRSNLTSYLCSKKSSISALCIMIRLLDEEIKELSLMRLPVTIEKWVEKKSQDSFRWETLKTLYF